MKYVTLGADGRATAFYDPALGAVPPGAIEIGDALWASWIGQTASVVYIAASQSLGPYVPPAPSQATLVAQLGAAASAACAAIVSQVYPDPAHQAALQNAANIAQKYDGPPPSSDALYAKFNNYAALYGMTPAAFAALAIAATGASLDLGAALGTLTADAAAAAASAQLATALASFETALAAVVGEINAASPPASVGAPPAISIAGINA